MSEAYQEYVRALWNSYFLDDIVKETIVVDNEVEAYLRSRLDLYWPQLTREEQEKARKLAIGLGIAQDAGLLRV